MAKDLLLKLKLEAEAAQYRAELQKAGQTLSTFTAQAQSGGASAAGAMDGTSTAAQAMGRAIEAGNRAHAAGALSAKEHAMAMRMLPMQMTDVVTSMASGMPVWMVAIQQGGQVKDSFGGVGNALRAIAGATSPVVAGLGALAAAGGLAAVAYAKGAAEADGYRQSIVMTGNAAGTSVNQLAEMARAVRGATETQGAAAQALTALAGTGAVAAGNLQQFAAVALDLERRVGQPIQATAQQLESLAKAPLQASLKLNEQYHYLTEAVYRQIKALQDQGQQEAAASLAQRTYAGAMADRTAELRSNLGTLERAWEGLGNMARRTWDAMLNVGRAATLSDVRAKIDDTNRQLNDLLTGDGFTSTGGGAATGAGARGRAAQIERLRKQLGELHAQAAPLEAADATAQIQAEQQATEAAKLAARQRIDTLSTAVRSRADIRKQEIEQLNRDRDTLALSAAEYNKLLAGINEKYKDPKGAAAQAPDGELARLQAQLLAARQYHEQLVTLGTGASELNAAERESLKLAEQIKLATDAKTIARLQEKQAIADALGAQLRSNAGLEQSLKAHQAAIDGNYKDAAALAERAQAQEAANAVFGQGRTAIEQMTLATLQHQLQEAEGSDSFDPKYIASLRAKIAAQEDWAAALGKTDAKRAEQHVNELLRGAQELARAYADEQQLSGLTALEREKIVAQRAVELKYAKELAAIDNMALADTEKQRLRDKALQAQRIESAAAVAKAEQQYMARAADEINRSLTDALMRGFESGKGFAKNFRDTLKNMFNTLVLRPVISAVMQPVSMAINGAVQGGGSAGSAMNLLSMGKDLYGAIQGGFATLGNNLAMYAQQGINYMTGAGAMSPTALPGSVAQGMGAAGATMAGVAGGIYGGRFVSGGYSAWGGSGNSAVNTGTAIGAAVGSIVPVIGTALGALVGGLLGGAVNRLFGRKLKDSGVEGDFGGDTGFEGRQFEYYKGGLFRSDKTKYASLDEETRKAFANTFDAMRDGARGMAETLGLGAQSVDDFTAHVKISLKGLSAEEADKRIKEELDKIAQSLAAGVLGTDEYTRANETALDTLTRLSGSLAAANAVFQDLGHTLYQASLAGGDMASQLLDLFGGADGFSQTTGAYFQNFYSGEEQRRAVERNLNDALSKLHLKLPDIDARDARAQYRSLADAQDLTTEAGRKAWAALLQLSGAFAGVTQSAEDAAAALSQAAKAEADARKAATDAAWAAMQKSIAGARDAAQAELDLRQARLASAKAVTDLARDQARELRGQVDSTLALTAAQGNAYIDSALTAARGGQLPDAAGLRQAIEGARAGMGTSAYANRLDYEAAQLILANKLDAIGDSGAAQVDVNQLLLDQAKAEVDRLDMLIKTGREALDEARGNTAAVLSVDASVKAFYDKLFAETGKDADATAGKPGGAFAIGGGGAGDGGGGSYDRTADIRAQIDRQLQLGAAGGLGHGDTGVLSSINAALYGQGVSNADIAKAYGVPTEDIDRLFAGAGIPRFDVGTNRVPRDMLAMVHEGEAIVPKAYNPWAGGAPGGTQGGNTAELARLLQELIAQGYAIGRRQVELMQSMETLARKQDAIGVKQREAVV